MAAHDPIPAPCSKAVQSVIVYVVAQVRPGEHSWSHDGVLSPGFVAGHDSGRSVAPAERHRAAASSQVLRMLLKRDDSGWSASRPGMRGQAHSARGGFGKGGDRFVASSENESLLAAVSDIATACCAPQGSGLSAWKTGYRPKLPPRSSRHPRRHPRRRRLLQAGALECRRRGAGGLGVGSVDGVGGARHVRN